MTEALPKHRASRAGFRAHLTKLLEKAATLMDKEMPSEVELVSLKNTLEQLARKRDKLKDLDERIAALLEEPDEIEKESFETEDIQDSIDETSSQISSFLALVSSKKTLSTVPLNATGKSLPLPHEIHRKKLPREVSPHRQKPLPHKLMANRDSHSNLKVPPTKFRKSPLKLFKTLHMYSHRNKIYPCLP